MGANVGLIQIKALAVIDNGNGTFGIELPERELTREDRQFLAKLYPNMLEKAFDLLNQEALLESIALPEEYEAPNDGENRVHTAKKDSAAAPTLPEPWPHREKKK